MLLPLLLTLSSPSFAEGAAELPVLTLETATLLGVDILDPSVERILFTGRGTVDVTDPAGNLLGRFMSGETIVPTVPGAYRLRLSAEQIIDWDVTVLNPVQAGGRLFSEAWWLNGRGYTQADAFDGQLFVRVMDDAAGIDSVVAVRLGGWVGYRWQFLANSTGPEGGPTAGSQPSRTADAPPQHRIYLASPAASTHAMSSPSLLDASFEAAGTGGTFSATTGTPGTLHIACDTDGDGAIDPAGGTDLALAEQVGAGEVSLTWDGRVAGGTRWEGPLPDCTVWLAAGEVHLLGVDIETAWPGIQLHHEASAGGSLDPLTLRWNDAAVADAAVPSPDGNVAALASGPDGMLSGAATSPMEPGVGARGWGDFTESSRGNVAVLDTWAWIEAASIDIPGVDPEPEPEPDTGEAPDPDTGTVDSGDPEPPRNVVDPGYYGGTCSDLPVQGPRGSSACWPWVPVSAAVAAEDSVSQPRIGGLRPAQGRAASALPPPGTGWPRRRNARQAARQWAARRYSSRAAG